MANNHPTSAVAPPSNLNQFTRLISGSLSDYVKREILKSEYEELIGKYQNSNELWTDPNFLPNDKSWGDPKHKVVWKRLSEVLPEARFVA
jgi:hypothetical protein